ncbi:MAG: Asp/Glu racemase [Gluconacetobacter diazotrophicus]|nr:Asp/Glu racemase [Gluconacetobacter diazotrophicus]
METEIPAMLRARELIRPERFAFHSSRMRMNTVSEEELAAMDGESDRCALELSDARVDILGYACLVAIMSQGHGYHRVSRERLEGVARGNGAPTPVVTSAGALVDALKVLGARRVVVLCPYVRALTTLVADYIAHEGFEIVDVTALEIPNNLDVARHDPERLPGIMAGMRHADADALILSACVQMPSLAVVPKVEALTGKPVLTASIATTYALLRGLGLERVVPGAGALLSGAY